MPCFFGITCWGRRRLNVLQIDISRHILCCFYKILYSCNNSPVPLIDLPPRRLWSISNTDKQRSRTAAQWVKSVSYSLQYQILVERHCWWEASSSWWTAGLQNHRQHWPKHRLRHERCRCHLRENHAGTARPEVLLQFSAWNMTSANTHHLPLLGYTLWKQLHSQIEERIGYSKCIHRQNHCLHRERRQPAWDERGRWQKQWYRYHLYHSIHNHLASPWPELQVRPIWPFNERKAQHLVQFFGKGRKEGVIKQREYLPQSCKYGYSQGPRIEHNAAESCMGRHYLAHSHEKYS